MSRRGGEARSALRKTPSETIEELKAQRHTFDCLMYELRERQAILENARRAMEDDESDSRRLAQAVDAFLDAADLIQLKVEQELGRAALLSSEDALKGVRERRGPLTAAGTAA